LDEYEATRIKLFTGSGFALTVSSPSNERWPFPGQSELHAANLFKEHEMKRANLVGLLALAFVLGAIVGTSLRPQSVAAASASHIQSWGITRDPQHPDYLVLYDSSTGEIWGYRENTLLGAAEAPIRIGRLSKVGAPIIK
jgi:hypothetical protein